MRFIRFVHAGCSFGVVFAAYWVYALCAVPLMEPPAAAGPGGGIPPEKDINLPTRRYHPQLAPFFSSDSWELNDARVLKTPEAFLLFGDYQPLEDGRLKIVPCTIVVPPGTGATVATADHSKSRKTTRGLVLQSHQGAVLTFDIPLDIPRGKIGRLVGGWLPGPIRIHATESRPGMGDAIDISTQNVKVNAEKIWTPSDVDIRVGSSVVSGRDLTIALDSAAASNKERSLVRSIVSGVASVELVQVSEIRVDMADRVTLTERQHTVGEDRSAARPTSLEATCRGPFSLDTSHTLATLEDEVRLTVSDPSGVTDRLECQRLTLHFSLPTGGSSNLTDTSPMKKASTAAKTSSTIQLDKLVAVGLPVTVQSARRDGNGRLQAEHVEYDMRARRIRIESQDHFVLDYGDYHIEASRVQCDLDDANNPERLWAAGPGWFRGPTRGDGSRPMRVTWRRQLELRPHQGERLLSLLGPAEIQAQDIGAISAEEIHLWMREGLSAPTTSSSRTSQAAGLAGHQKLQPTRMQAEGNVRLASNQIDCATQHLEVWIEPSQSSAASAASSTYAGTPFSEDSRDTSGLHIGGRATSADADSRKLTVSGDRIRARFAGQQRQVQLENVSVHGRASLQESSSSAEVPVSLQMTGDVFELRRASSPDAEATILGEQATIQARGLRLVGSRIELHRGSNKMWIEGAGQARLPVSRGFSGETLDRPTTLTVDWDGKMAFNGHTVRFVDSVIARSDQQVFRAAVLSATIEPAINFQVLPQSVPEPKVRYVEGSGKVGVESRSHDEMGLVSVERIRVDDFGIDMFTGDLKARGPGWISTVRRHDASFSAVSPKVSAPARSDGLDYLRVTFQDGISGNLTQRVVYLNGHVEAIYGPVASWHDQLTVAAPEQLGDHTYLLNCDQLMVAQLRPGPVKTTPVVLRASGNTVIEGNRFAVRGHRVSYSQDKDQLILEGDGRTPAHLLQRTGGREAIVPARKITFWPTKNTYTFEGLDSAQFEDNRPASRFDLLRRK